MLSFLNKKILKCKKNDHKEEYKASFDKEICFGCTTKWRLCRKSNLDKGYIDYIGGKVPFNLNFIFYKVAILWYMGKRNKTAQCGKCNSEMRSDTLKRHLRSCGKPPESINKRHTLCPVCKKIMLIDHVKRHMQAKHGADR